MRTSKTTARRQAVQRTSASPTSTRRLTSSRNVLSSPSIITHTEQHVSQYPLTHPTGIRYSLADIPIEPASTISSQDDNLRNGISAASTLIIQRATTAKDPAPAPKSSGQVADLPANVMAQLNSACTNKASEKDRQDALDLIYDYLNSQNLIDNVKKSDFIYSSAKSSSYGLATPYTDKDAPYVELKIYSNAFNEGPAVVYSTIRHELIHAEQYRLQPSGPPRTTTSGDAFFYYHRGTKNSVPVGTGSEYIIRAVISEIETHAWEIENSAATSISATFKNNRVTSLEKFYKQLIEHFGKLSSVKQQKWQAYVQKAKSMAEAVLSRELNNFTPQTLSASSPAKGKGKIKGLGVNKPPSRKKQIHSKLTVANATRNIP